jgi:imidazolonepropionase-like amidohydrolase
MSEAILAAGQVLLGPSGMVIPDGAVAVTGGTITDVGPRSDVAARNAGLAITDFPGATIMPGMIDCHVHFAFDASADPVTALRGLDDPTLLLGMAARARQLLDAVVTTARDLGDRNGLAATLRDAVTAGTVAGPRILTAGPPITVTGGHCWFLGGEADGANEIRSVVRRNIRRGADLIKMMVTGGHLTPSGPPPSKAQFAADEIALAVTEAGRFNRRVAAHVHSAGGIEAAVAADVATLEHCGFGVTGPEPATSEERARIVAEIVRKGIFVCPTFSAAISRVAGLLGEAALADVLELVRYQHEHGVRLIAGTDAGVTGAHFDRYAEGLIWLGRAGIGNAAIIEMATITAADALGIGEQTGRLAAGFDADLLVIDGDPVRDLADLQQVELVLARGRVHRPAVGYAGVAPIV